MKEKTDGYFDKELLQGLLLDLAPDPVEHLRGLLGGEVVAGHCREGGKQRRE